MTLSEYWDYLGHIIRQMTVHGWRHHEFEETIFKLTASPYHYWEKQQLLLKEHADPAPSGHPSSTKLPAREGSSVGIESAGSGSGCTKSTRAPKPSSSPETEDPTIFAEKATEIRSFVRERINDKEFKDWSKTARNALLMLLDGRRLDEAQDDELITWWENWVDIRELQEAK
jgi:hypothetical protein